MAAPTSLASQNPTMAVRLRFVKELCLCLSLTERAQLVGWHLKRTGLQAVQPAPMGCWTFKAVCGGSNVRWRILEATRPGSLSMANLAVLVLWSFSWCCLDPKTWHQEL